MGDDRVGDDWIRRRWEKADAARVKGDWSAYANPADFETPDMEASLTNAAAVEQAALSGADRRRWSPTRWRKHDRGTHPTRLCYPRVRRPKLDRIAWQCVAVYAALGLVFIWTLWLCRAR